jgi:hypothetical protein
VRVGTNPAKAQTGLGGYGLHRIILPVYIPHFDGYFQHAREILRLCLESLRLTAAHAAAITIVANGCAPAVTEELTELDFVDQLIVNRENRGKIDAVVTVARGSYEPLVTISDCDVLFRRGWLDATEQLFQAFPECGYACPFPSPAGAWHHTSATHLGALARGERGREPAVDGGDLDRFAASIERPDLYKTEHRATQWIVRRGDAIACIGAGHFACTLRREVLAGMPGGPSLQAIEGRSELRWLDLPPDRLGFWRLSTPRAWVHHMGNVPEPWMHDELAALRESGAAEPNAPHHLPAAQRRWTSRIPIFMRRKLARILEITQTES